MQHNINIRKNTILNKILCANKLTVNSHHHQAIKRISSSLNIAAKSESGIIEAVENKDENFLMGVQWHPEDLIDNCSCFNNLFAELIKIDYSLNKKYIVLLKNEMNNVLKKCDEDCQLTDISCD